MAHRVQQHCGAVWRFAIATGRAIAAKGQRRVALHLLEQAPAALAAVKEQLSTTPVPAPKGATA